MMASPMGRTRRADRISTITVLAAVNKNGLLYYLEPDTGHMISSLRQGPYIFAASFGLAANELLGL